MILIADSGSTHTTWALVDRDSSDVLYCETPGINPYYQDEDEIVAVLSDEFSELAALILRNVRLLEEH